jgi:hypothetical protein
MQANNRIPRDPAYLGVFRNSEKKMFLEAMSKQTKKIKKPRRTAEHKNKKALAAEQGKGLTSIKLLNVA